VIVVDSNVMAYLYLPSQHAHTAERLLERDPSWAVPILWRSEFRNILAGYMRRKMVTLESACALQAEAERLVFGAEYEPDSRLVLELVNQSDCSAYDCEFVALAMTLNTQLVTAGKQLLKAFPKTAIDLRDFR
jgi:predicted nucleic acid-binding protein